MEYDRPFSIQQVGACLIDDAWLDWTKDFSSNISGLKDGTQKQVGNMMIWIKCLIFGDKWRVNARDGWWIRCQCERKSGYCQKGDLRN
jgi:hypothetical protein